MRLAEGPFGGGSQFLKALRNYFKYIGVYEENPNNADIIIFNSYPFNESFRFKQAFKLKKRNKILIHRIDGPIYKVRGKDLIIDKIIYNFNNLLADGTIFQSEWSKFANLEQKMKKSTFEAIIINAPDKNIFNKKEKAEFNKNRKIKLVASSWSSNWNKGFETYKFLDQSLDFDKYEMTFIGNSPIRFKHIKMIKPLKSNELAKELKKNDIFITASRNDPCSNSLIEALHCGLPAIVLNDGGHPEIIGNSGLAFDNHYEILEKIEQISNNYEFYQKSINLPDIEYVAKKYLEFLTEIFDNFKKKDYKLKKIRRFKFLNLKLKIFRWNITKNGILNYFLNKFKAFFLNNFKIPIKQELIKSQSCAIEHLINKDQKDLNWIFKLKEEVPRFLGEIKGKRRKGFYKYSLTGDFFDDKIRWGLGNTVFFLKIVYTLNLVEKYKKEIKDALSFLLSFQKKNGTLYDPLVKILSLPFRIYITLKTLNLSALSHKSTIRAETRQSISTLSLFKINPLYEYRSFPNTKEKIQNYLKNLNWEFPWAAGSHFSHLLFFLNHSKLQNKDELLKIAIDQIENLQHEKDGFWYERDPNLQQKINGAMKIITGLKVVNMVSFKYPEKMINVILDAKNDEQACDNFNIVYVLKYCCELTNYNYRYNEIKDFVYERLVIYRKNYFLELGGFSFFEKGANRIYYGAYLNKGRIEPDVHGTVLFLWGISIIAQILKINDKLQFKEFIP